MRKAGIIIAMAVWIVTAVRLINVNVRAGEDVVTAFNTIKYDNVDTIIEAFGEYGKGFFRVSIVCSEEELKEANTRYQEVKDENSYYTSEKEKLQDPDYIQSYARGNYMLSKDGEQIFYLPEKDN